MPNPLLEMTGLPPFQDIRPEHAEPAVDTVLAENRAALDALLNANGPYGWDNLVAPLEAMEDRLERVFSPISHMNAVVNTEPLREAYNNCRSKISAYHTELGQNAGLFGAFTAIAEGPEYQQLDSAQRKVINDALRDFRLTGIDLPKERKERFKAISQELSRLTSRFDENLLDATHGWTKSVTDESRLAGLPDSAKGLLHQYAEREKRDGWLVTLEFPSYYAVMTHADDRPLREEVYQAFSTRASDRGPQAGEWDNSGIMEDILRLRHEQAKLLGFANFAERSLATKMAETPQQVVDFLRDLAGRSVALARHELDELTVFARERDGLQVLQAWDIGYYAEKLRQARYNFSQEELKPFFPAERVISGMFSVVKKLYGIDIREVKGVAVWQEDVRFFEIRDNRDQLRGSFYLDLFARPHKRGGAWMDECISRRRREDGTIQNPVAYLTCNFAPPVGENPALLTHDEVTTLFHEFGHGLHHMLTRVDYADISGINGVPWDAVELPSQFMENWCWERDAIDLIAGHYRSGKPLPEALFEKLRAARNFNVGIFMVRQLEFSLFDFRLHLEYEPTEGGRIQEVLDQVREEVAVIRPPDYNRFQHGFAHIFSGGYAAGYYSYKWAEVLSADAFSRFEEEGIFNRKTGAAFLESILEQGGSREPMDLFVAFRGRKPKIDALLRHSGIAA